MTLDLHGIKHQDVTGKFDTFIWEAMKQKVVEVSVIVTVLLPANPITVSPAPPIAVPASADSIVAFTIGPSPAIEKSISQTSQP